MTTPAPLPDVQPTNIATGQPGHTTRHNAAGTAINLLRAAVAERALQADLESAVDTLEQALGAKADAAALQAETDDRIAQSAETETALAALVKGSRGDALLGVAASLEQASGSFAVQVLGDSTNTPDTAWFRQLANEVAAAYPALTHHYRKWNDTTQDHDRPIVLSTGAAGRRAMLMAAGSPRSGMQLTGDNLTGDIDVRINLKQTTWATGIFAAKWSSDTQISWDFNLGGDGRLYFMWTTDGTLGTRTGAQSSVAPSLVNGQENWLRAVFDKDNGAGNTAVTFYTSTDGATWTQLGAVQTKVGIVTIFPSTSRYSIGARGASSSPIPGGSEVYEVQIRDGIDGACILPILPELWMQGIGTNEATFTGAPVVTWLMSAHPGATLSYMYDVAGYLDASARMPKMALPAGQLAVFYGASHNGYRARGDFWTAALSNWISGTTGRSLSAARIVLTQNPRTGSFEGNEHKRRRAEAMAWVRRTAGVDLIDTYQAFLDDGRALDPTLIADGLHPSNAGYTVWKNAVKAELDAALDRVPV